MPLQPCSPEPFTGTQQFMVPYGSNIISYERTTGPLIWTIKVIRRPFVPLWGVKPNVDGGYDFIISTQANAKTLIDIAVDCYNASVNYALDQNDPLAFPQQYQPVNSINFGTYLYRKVNADPCLISRYIEVYNKAAQFFRLHAAIVAFDIALYKELQILQNAIQEQIDKQMMIPPGLYNFYTGSVAAASLEAWFTADNTFKGLYGIELTTT